jgi:hypothetical protein
VLIDSVSDELAGSVIALHIGSQELKLSHAATRQHAKQHALETLLAWVGRCDSVDLLWLKYVEKHCHLSQFEVLQSSVDDSVV